MTRIALGGLMHESNTFADGRTNLDAFIAGGLETGDGMHRRWGEAHHEVGGFFEAARECGFTPVPTLMGWAWPSGPLLKQTYAELSDRLVAALRQAEPVDAVLIALHGAMVAEGEDDADGSLLARIRDVIGPTRPLIVTLDLHGNVSPRMVEASDAIVAYRTYPHIDQRECGLRAGRLAHRAAAGEVRPVQAMSKPPMLIPLLAQQTSREPLRSFMQGLKDLDRSPGFLDGSLLPGFPYADVAATGPACIAVTDGDPKLAQETAEALAERLWSLRGELLASPPEAPTAVARALQSSRPPVALVDLGDNIGGGSAADSTVLFHELVRQGATDVIGVLYDPEAVQACIQAGVGSDVALEVGGKIDRHAAPLTIRGRVRVIHEGKYVEDLPRHGGQRLNDQGVTVVVESADGLVVVLTSQRHPPFSLGQLTSLGLRPESARILIVKAAVAFRAAYEPIAGEIIEVDTPGLTASNPCRYTYQRIRRPILPLDAESVVEAARR